MNAKDHYGRTVLAFAASSNTKDTFDTVLAALMKELDPAEVSHPHTFPVANIIYTF